MYEKPILYCTHCFRQGHGATTCRIEKINKKDMNHDVQLPKDVKDGDKNLEKGRDETCGAGTGSQVA